MYNIDHFTYNPTTISYISQPISPTCSKWGPLPSYERVYGRFNTSTNQEQHRKKSRANIFALFTSTTMQTGAHYAKYNLDKKLKR